MIVEGQKFPEFSLPNQNGWGVTNKTLAGKWFVVYVYPKDDTPGCTIQGKTLSSAKDEFEKLGVTVLGLSQDDVASHKNFCSKFGFKIDLLADVNATLLKALGVPQSDYKGTMYWDRTTFLVDGQGNIRKVYTKVNPAGHDKLLLGDIKQLQRQG